MRKLLNLTLFLGLIILASCSSEIDPGDNPLLLPGQVKFTSTIGSEAESRVTGNNWDQGDAIGVYALNAGSEIPGGIYGKANAKFTTASEGAVGTFTAATVEDQIVYPIEGEKLDFVAYYPYGADVTNHQLPVDVSDQTNSAAIDYLYADNVKGKNKDDVEANLVFKHRLSQLIINISESEGLSLQTMSGVLQGLKTDGVFHLVDGAVTPGETTGDIVPQFNQDKSIAVAILVPGQNLKDVTFEMIVNGKTYNWKPESQTIESGKKYSYNLKLSQEGTVLDNVGATIEDWEDGYIGSDDIILNPDDEDEPAVGDKLLFPGSDFEDWDAFLGSLLNDKMNINYGSQSDAGMDGGKALHLNGTQGSNGYAFTALVPEGFDQGGSEAIVFWIKGTSANRSLSMNIHTTEGEKYYNLGDCSSDVVLEATNQNNYVGAINATDWVKVTFDISGLELESTPGEKLFAVKVGKGGEYDLLIDNLMLEGAAGGGDDGADPVEPEVEPMFPGGDFEDWAAFIDGLNSYGLQNYAKQVDGGRNDSKALHIDGTPPGNDFLFTALVPEGFDPAGKNAIVFYMKGTAGKSLSLNVYKNGGGYQAFNLAEYKAERIIEPAANNQYVGEINTGGDWMEVVVDISSVDMITTVGQNLFAVKVGKDAVYDLLLDDFTLEAESIKTFKVDKTSLSLGADSNLSETINLTSTEAWTATSSESWLTVSPASGNGNKAVTITATENKAEQARAATVTFKAAGMADIVVNVSQAAAAGESPDPAGNLLFPGSDFEDWDAFLGALNRFGLKPGYTFQSDNGRNGSKALLLDGEPGGNDYVFTAVVPQGFSGAGKTTISFWIKGTSTKSLSMNVTKDSGTAFYNLDDVELVDSDITLSPSGSNSYHKGNIDTKGEWIKITLDISNIVINETVGGDLFALKVGKKEAVGGVEGEYEILVDDITIE